MSDDFFDALFAAPGQPQSKLEIKFWAFHNKHPEVYAMLVSLTRKWIARRRGRRIGIKTVYEAARYALFLEKDDDGLMLNNNHTAYYARLIMNQEKDLSGVFLLRKQRKQSSIGPDNDTLPPSDHIA